MNSASRAGCMTFSTHSRLSLARKRKLQSYSPGSAAADTVRPYSSSASRSASAAETVTAVCSSRNMDEILSAIVRRVHPVRPSPAFSARPYTGEEELAETMKLKLPTGDFAAYLFDCDGTIADSMPLHYVAWKKALGEWGCDFDEDLFYSWGGLSVAKIISLLNEERGLNMPVAEVEHRKESLYYELLPQLTAVPEV